MANVGLYRSRRYNMVAGVMGGIAERFGWNVTLLRIIFVLISCLSAAFPGILVYLVLWLVIPKQANGFYNSNSAGQNNPIRTINDYDSTRR